MKISRFALLGLVLMLAILCGTCMSACAADTDEQTANESYGQTADIPNTENKIENADETGNTNETENESEVPEMPNETMLNETMNITIGEYTFTATLEKNAAVDELVDMLKKGTVTISMTDYSGFEKVGSLGSGLTTSDSQTTTAEGDIVLYNGNNIVMFYGSNSWSYTRIGKVNDLTNWRAALGRGSITAVFSLPE